MTSQLILPRPLGWAAALLLVLMLLLAAVINVPWALSFMRSRTTIIQVPTANVFGEEAAKAWPALTPHDQPWPAPTQWMEGRVFGCRVYNVYHADETRQTRFGMSAQHLGWPLPVIEQKQMWWDWNDPALAGPESDPAPSLLLRGLILNPIILGGGAWLVLVLPWVVAIVGIRSFRKRRNRCLDCGYPAMSGSAVCTECGSALNESPQTPKSTSPQ